MTTVSAIIDYQAIHAFEYKQSSLHAALPLPMTRSGSILRLVKDGNSKQNNKWEETTMSLDGSRKGELVVFPGENTILSAETVIEVLWVWDERTGQKFQFFIDSSSSEGGSSRVHFQVFSLAELESWLLVFQSHGCVINRPLKIDTIRVRKQGWGFVKPKLNDGWGILYANGLHFYEQIHDSAANMTVTIGEGSAIESLEGSFFCLRGDEHSQSIVFQGIEWYQACLSAVNKKFQKKYVDSIHEGYLLKNGQGSVAWKRRYFVLMPDRMKYFKHRRDERPIGKILLPSGADAEGVNESNNNYTITTNGGGAGNSSSGMNDSNVSNNVKDNSQKFQFWVAETGDATGTRRYKLAANFEAEKELWLRHLHFLFSTKNNRVLSTSIREGYLYKKGMTGNWTKRYVVLLEDGLYDSAKRNDFNDKTKFDLKNDYINFTEISFVDLRDGPELFYAFSTDIFSLAESGDESTVTCTLRAPDSATLRAWVSDLRVILKQNDVTVNPNSLLEGYLRIQQSVLGSKKWVRGYFILLETSLSYYRGRRDNQPCSSIPIFASTDIQIIEVKAEKEKEKVMFAEEENMWQFSVEGEDNEGLHFILCAETEEERSLWMNILGANIKAQNKNLFPDSIFEGYMWKPSGGKVMTKRYFVLKKGMLYYYKKRSDTEESGSIEIKFGCEIIVIDKEDSSFPYMFSVAKSGDEGERVFLMCCRDKNSRSEWISHIYAQIDLCPVIKEEENSTCECYVLIRRENEWKKRFCILEEDSISFYLKRNDPNKKLEMSMKITEDTFISILDDITIEGVWGNLDTSTRFPPPDTVSWREIDLLNFITRTNLEAFSENREETLLNDYKRMEQFECQNFHRAPEHEKAKEDKDLQMVICNNSEKEIRNIRLKGIDESFVSSFTELCIKKEFPSCSVDTEDILKSGYLMCYHISFPDLLDPWRASFVILKKDEIIVKRNRMDDNVACVISLNAQTKFFHDRNDGINIVEDNSSSTDKDKDLGSSNGSSNKENHIVLKPQREDEKNSWSSAIGECLCSSPVRSELFGGDLKKSFQVSTFFRLPYVITSCVEYLRRHPSSFSSSSCSCTCSSFASSFSAACSLKHPGFFPQLRDLIQDFENGAPIVFATQQAETVAMCLKLYLKMLRVPLLPDNITDKLSTFLENSCDLHGMKRILSKLDGLNSSSSSTSYHTISLSVVLYYLHGEIEKGIVTFDEIISWCPVLMRGKNTNHQIAILSMLIHNVYFFFPHKPVPVLKLPLLKFKRIKLPYLSLRFDEFRRSKHGMSLFTRFVTENYVAENVLFLNAVSQYKQICSATPQTEEEKQLASQTKRNAARYVCDTFIRPGVENQINISSDLAASVLSLFQTTTAATAASATSTVSSASIDTADISKSADEKSKNDQNSNSIGEVEEELSGEEFARIEAEVNTLITTNEFSRFQKTELFDEWVTFRYRAKNGPTLELQEAILNEKNENTTNFEKNGLGNSFANMSNPSGVESVNATLFLSSSMLPDTMSSYAPVSTSISSYCSPFSLSDSNNSSPASSPSTSPTHASSRNNFIFPFSASSNPNSPTLSPMNSLTSNSISNSTAALFSLSHTPSGAPVSISSSASSSSSSLPPITSISSRSNPPPPPLFSPTVSFSVTLPASRVPPPPPPITKDPSNLKLSIDETKQPPSVSQGTLIPSVEETKHALLSPSLKLDRAVSAAVIDSKLTSRRGRAASDSEKLKGALVATEEGASHSSQIGSFSRYGNEKSMPLPTSARARR